MHACKRALRGVSPAMPRARAQLRAARDALQNTPRNMRRAQKAKIDSKSRQEIDVDPSVVCMITTGVFSGEWSEMLAADLPGCTVLVPSLAAGVTVALAYQTSVVVCTTRNSALATSVTGSFKDIFASCGSWVVIGDLPTSLCEIGGMLLNVVGTLAFVCLKGCQLCAPAPKVKDD